VYYYNVDGNLYSLKTYDNLNTLKEETGFTYSLGILQRIDYVLGGPYFNRNTGDYDVYNYAATADLKIDSFNATAVFQGAVEYYYNTTNPPAPDGSLYSILRWTDVALTATAGSDKYTYNLDGTIDYIEHYSDNLTTKTGESDYFYLPGVLTVVDLDNTPVITGWVSYELDVDGYVIGALDDSGDSFTFGYSEYDPMAWVPADYVDNGVYVDMGDDVEDGTVGIYNYSLLPLFP
jgi:hypothetical protein